MALSDEDVERIAVKMHEFKEREYGKSDFYISPKEHYDSHQNLGEMYKDWTQIKDTFTKAFLGLVMVGLIASIAFGAIISVVKDIPDYLKGH